MIYLLVAAVDPSTSCSTWLGANPQEQTPLILQYTADRFCAAIRPYLTSHTSGTLVLHWQQVTLSRCCCANVIALLVRLCVCLQVPAALGVQSWCAPSGPQAVLMRWDCTLIISQTSCSVLSEMPQMRGVSDSYQ